MLLKIQKKKTDKPGMNLFLFLTKTRNDSEFSPFDMEFTIAVDGSDRKNSFCPA